MNSKTALIIEPLQRHLRLISAMLKQKKFSVRVGDRMDDIAVIVKNREADVLFIAEEMRFRQRSGIDICRALNKIFDGNVPILITCEKANYDMVFESIRAGALGFVIKPPRAKLLFDKVNKAISCAKPKVTDSKAFQGLKIDPSLPIPKMLDIVIEQAEEIKALPQAVAKITQVSQDDKAGARTMEKAVNSDPSVAAMVIKRSNSAFYKGQNQITLVQDAVVRIGFEECRKLVLGMSIFKLFDNEQKSFGFNRIHFWLHSVATAVIAEELCKRKKDKRASDAFICGLLHDFGKIVLDDYLAQHFQKALQQVNIKNKRLYEIEKDIFEKSHSVVTRAVLDRWNFPENLTEAVQKHHVVPQMDNDGKTESGVNEAVFLANQMAKATMLGFGGDVIATPIPDGLWDAFGYRDSNFKAEELEETFKKVEDALAFLGVTEKDIGFPIKKKTLDANILFVHRPGFDHRMVTYFLTAQGFSVTSVKASEDLPDGEFVACLFNAEDDEADCNKTVDLLQAKYSMVSIIGFTPTLQYSNEKTPEPSHYFSGAVHFYDLKHQLSKIMAEAKK